MPLVVFLKGINVGGHRSFRPSVLAKELQRFDAVNVGTAGSFVIRNPPSQMKLRAEITRRLPFEAEVMICNGRDILRLASSDPFAGHTASRDIVQFVSVLARRREPRSPIPLSLPASGDWGLRVLAQDGRFVFGLYRGQMKAIGYLGQLETIFGVPVTTRSWSTMLAIARIVDKASTHDG